MLPPIRMVRALPRLPVSWQRTCNHASHPAMCMKRENKRV